MSACLLISVQGDSEAAIFRNSCFGGCSGERGVGQREGGGRSRGFGFGSGFEWLGFGRGHVREHLFRDWAGSVGVLLGFGEGEAGRRGMLRDLLEVGVEGVVDEVVVVVVDIVEAAVGRLVVEAVEGNTVLLVGDNFGNWRVVLDC